MKLDQSQILSVVDYQIDRCTSFMENRISYERAMAYDFYYGRPFGNEVEGRSSVISQDVAQVVDSATPALVKIFVGGEKAVEFVARGPEDVKAAEQATVGCNYVFFTQNNGYQITHDVIKDGLLQKSGTVSWYWDEKEETKTKTFMGLDDLQFQMLAQQVEAQGAEFTAHDEKEIEQVPGQKMTMHNVEVKYKQKVGRIKVCVLPPEEVLISPDAMSLDPYEMPFICHTPLVTGSDLVEMGIKKDVIETLPQGDDNILFSDERIARKNRLDATSGLVDEEEAGPDKSQWTYRLYRCWIRIDEDGDGIAELREIWKVGDTILRDEETDHIPLAIWTPKVMPHECIGISLADDVMDIQELKSVLWRGALDNIYLTNAPRMYVNESAQVNIDDVLTVRPGGVIRGNAPAGNAIQPIAIPFMAQYAFQALEYADQEEEVRTGISRLFQGIDPQSINKTATGVNALMNAANARVELMARNAAEFLFKPLFKGILYLLAKHQTEQLMVRLQNNYVPLDPDTWSKEYDMTVNVGLGTGTKEQQLQQLMMIAQAQSVAAGSPMGPMLVSPKNIYNTQAKLCELAGFKDPDQFWTNPETVPPPPPPGPPPEVQKAQMQIQADQQKFQAEMGMKQAEMQQNAQIEQGKLQTSSALEIEKLNREYALKEAQMQQEFQLKREQMIAELALKREQTIAEQELKREQGMISTLSSAALQREQMAADQESEASDSEGEDKVAQAMSQVAEALKLVARPRNVRRGPDGRVAGID